MPELPEVETIVRQLSPDLTGAVVDRLELHSPHVMRRQTMPARALRRQTILQVSRRGKFVRIRLSGHLELLVHLRMSGNLRLVGHDAKADKHDHADLVLADGRRLRFRDVRKFGGFMLLDDRQSDHEPPLSELGPEPLEISLDDFRRLLASTSRAIKALLLDQRRLAGMGNIYCDEALFIAAIHPATPARAISPEKGEKLWQAMRQVLTQAIEHKGSSVDSYRTPEGKSGNYQNLHLAYGRAGRPCPHCGTLLQKFNIAGRGTTLCPKCQRLMKRRSRR